MQTMYDATSALHEDEILTSGVLSRRFAAWWVDMVLIGVLMAGAYTMTAAFGLVTLGLGWYLLPWVPVVPFLYHWISLASPMSATPGQAMLGLTLAVFCPALLIVLFTVRKRSLHDMVSGLVLVRRRALTPPSGYWNNADNR